MWSGGGGVLFCVVYVTPKKKIGDSQQSGQIYVSPSTMIVHDLALEREEKARRHPIRRKKR